MPTLLAVPNFSEGRDARAIAAIAAALVSVAGARLLDTHSDPDHNRSVFTLAGAPTALTNALLAGARAALGCVDIAARPEQCLDDAYRVDGADGGQRRGCAAAPARRGAHPYVGVLDVAPIVYLERGLRGLACAQALVLGERIGAELGVPVFIYGELAAGRTRAFLRKGGPERLAARLAASELAPDFGPPHMHVRAGASLVCAREPLVAFNLELSPPADLGDARRIAALVREGGAEGLTGVRAIGVQLRSRNRAQVSMNVERPLELALAAVVEAVRRHARLECAEIVGLVPQVALTDFPEDLPIRGFAPQRQVIESALACASRH